MKKLVMRGALAAIVAGGLYGGAAYAGSAIPGADGVIHGCYRTTDGLLRVIDPALASCRRGETSIQWNERGPQGIPGPALGTTLRRDVTVLQTQVAGLQTQVVGLETRVAVPSPTPTATSTPAVALQSISIAPANTPLSNPVQLVATGQYADGTTRDITALVTWSIVSGSGATLSSSGFFTCPGGGLGGTFTVDAALGGVVGSAQELCPVG